MINLYLFKKVTLNGLKYFFISSVYSLSIVLYFSQFMENGLSQENIFLIFSMLFSLQGLVLIYPPYVMLFFLWLFFGCFRYLFLKDLLQIFKKSIFISAVFIYFLFQLFMFLFSSQIFFIINFSNHILIYYSLEYLMMIRKLS